MAGYVKVLRSIWSDDDFKTLTVAAQRLYFLLISQADLTHVGVLPLTAARWSALAADSYVSDIRADLALLADTRFVIVDHDTEEILVRSYIIHDEAFKVPNSTKSLVSAYGKVLSQPLRDIIATTLETVGVTLDPTVEPTVEPTPDGTVEPPQQPAASSQKPLTSQQQQQPAATAPESPSLELVPNHDAAAAAIDAFIAFKITKDDVGSPVRLQAKLRSTVPDEYGPALTAYLHRRPATDERELLRRVFLLNPANTEKALNEARKMTGAA